MKGLLRKDLYMLWNYGRTLLAISVIFLIVGALPNETNFFFVIYPVLFGGILPVTLLSYEERWGWDKVCDTLPLSRRTVVCARYVTTLVCFLALYALTLATQAAACIPRGRAKDVLDLAALLPSIGLLAPAVMLPLSLRFGVEKARIAYYVVIGVVVVLGIMVMQGSSTLGAEIGSLGLAASLLLSAVIFGASWLLSIRLYEKREL